MNRKEEINQEQESIHPILLWILASILFHFLITIGLITLKLKKMNTPDKKHKKSEETFLLMDEPNKQQPLPKPIPTQQSQPKNKTEPKTTQPKEQKQRHWSDYTLVPGRQGLDQQNIDNPADLQNLPIPEKQQSKNEPKKKNQTPKTLPQDPSNQDSVQKKESTKQTKSDTITLNESSEQKQSTKNLAKSRIPIVDQNPYDFVPELSNRTLSFKDLHLGFDNNYKTIGNNANLIQAGKTFESPDPKALKHLTYFNQCAEMMKAAFATHPQVRLCPYPFGSRHNFTITVNRNGKLLNFRTLAGSGNQILDKVISESVQSIALFPPVPKFIIEDPFVMNWAFLH